MTPRGFSPGKATYALVLPLLCIAAVVGVLPFVAAAWDSVFHDIWGTRSFAGLENYRDLIRDRAFFLSFGISAVWAILSALLSTVAGFVLAIVLLESKNRHKVLFAALLVPWGVPAFISVPIWRMLIHGSGGRSIVSALFGFDLNLLTDPIAGFSAALAVNVWLAAPLSAFAFYAALSRLPRAALESAAMDGASGWTMTRWIHFPQVRSTVYIMGALELVKAFKEFNVPFLMTAGGPPFRAGITERHIVGATTTLEIFLYDAFRNLDDYGVPSAYATAVGGLIIVATLLWLSYRRRMRKLDPSTSAKPSGKIAQVLWTALKAGTWLAVITSAVAVLYTTIWLAFSDLSAVYIDGFAPRFLSLRPFLVVLREEGIFRYFLNTLVVAGATALLVPIVIFPAAWLLSRARPEQTARVFGFAEALGMTGGIHSLIPLYVVFRTLGLLGGFVPIVVVYLFHALPFALFTISAYLRNLPRCLAEAAELEGMTWQAWLVRILAPLSAPVLAAAMMAAFLSAWNGFLVPLVFLSDDSLYTIGIKLHSYVGSVASGNPQWNLFAAASILNMIIVGLLLYRFKDPLGSKTAGEIDEA